MMTLRQVQALALSQVGTKEVPDGSNRVKYSLWYGLIGAWCMMFAQWLMWKAGIKVFRTASTVAFVKHYRKLGQFHEGIKGVQPGALLLYHWPGSTRASNQPDHVEFVFSVPKPGAVNDIGGNVGNKVSRIRRSGNFLGWVMPTYMPEPKPKPVPAPVVPPTPPKPPVPAPKPAPIPTVKVVVKGLNLRSHPSVLGKKLAVVPLGIVLPVRARNGVWILTAYRKIHGWVCSRSAIGKKYVK